MEFPLGRLKDSWINGLVATAIIVPLGLGVYMLCAVIAGAFAWAAVHLHAGGYGVGAVVGWSVALVTLVPLGLGEAIRLINKASGWVAATIAQPR